jgi:hypothetical protein
LWIFGTFTNQGLNWARFLEEEAMSALRKRHERWEYQNQKRLEQLSEQSQAQIQKRMVQVFDTLSFLLYLAYGVGRWLVSVPRLFWIQPPDHETGTLDAEQQRRKLRANASFWLK